METRQELCRGTTEFPHTQNTVITKNRANEIWTEGLERNERQKVLKRSFRQKVLKEIEVCSKMTPANNFMDAQQKETQK